MTALPMMHLGFAEMAIVLLLGGGVSLPVGVPPAPEDPLLARVAPEQCLYYTTWSGLATPDANSDNHTEQLLAEPEIQHLVREAEARVRRVLARRASEQNDAKAATVTRVLPELIKTVVTHAAAVYVTELRPGPQGMDVDAAAIVRLGDASRETGRQLQELQEAFATGQEPGVLIGGTEFRRLNITPGAPPVTWGIKEGYLILGVGQHAVETLLGRMETDAPAWLAELRQQLPIERRSTLTYANLGRFIETAATVAGDPQVRAAIDALGLGSLTSYEATSGLDGDAFVSKSLVRIDGQPEGVLAACAGEPLAAEDLEGIPADALIALTLRLDAEKVLETVIELMGRLQPRAAAEIEEGLEEVRADLGLDVRTDVLGTLGDVWQVYTSPGQGGPVTGWTATVKVRDAQRLTATINRMIGFAQASFARGRRSPQVRQIQFAGETIYFLSAPDDDFPIAPSWCIADDRAIVALYPQAIKSRLSRKPQDGSLADVPEVAALFREDGGPLLLAYLDTKPLFELFYPIVQMFARVGCGELQKQGIDVDVSLLPSAGSISRHLRPAVSALRQTSQGFETEVRQTLPGGNVGAAAPLSIAFLLPAVQSAREAARRTQSMNNLKIIGLAMHNFHDTYKAFPSAHSTDEDGKPLLSWRVYILPFVDAAPLYDQFHLDEPWDSPHNRTLIPQMPAAYRSPNSKAEPGKTVYLALRHEQGILVPPRPSQPSEQSQIGTKIAHITDGTSNTILAVEANDDSAVIWTKPDDLEPDMDNVFQGLLGTRPNGFLALLCDGSVRFIAQTIDPVVLKALITRSGGEVVQIP